MVKKILMAVVIVFLVACVGFLAQERYRLGQLVVGSNQTIADLKDSVDKLNGAIADLVKQLEEKQSEVAALAQQKEDAMKYLEEERQRAIAEKEKISKELSQGKEEIKDSQEKLAPLEPAIPSVGTEIVPAIETEIMPEGEESQVQASAEEQVKLEI